MRKPQRTVTLEDGWSAGRKLAEARLQLGLSIEQVAERTKVRSGYLEALEAMNAKLLPGRAYAVAYLRSYAQALGLDVEAIVTQYLQESALSREDARPQIRAPDSKPARERPWMLAALLGLVAGGFVAWRAMDNDGPAVAEAGRTLSPARAPAAQGPGLDDPAMLALRTLEIRALSEGWLEVRAPDGTIFFSETLLPGEAYRPDPSPDWTLHARDGGAFMLYLSGVEAGLLGEPGQPVLGRAVNTVVAPGAADGAAEG